MCEYHAPLITPEMAKSIVDSIDPNDLRSNYLFCIPDRNMYLDGSLENCVCHPQTRLLGRLINWAEQGSHSCNLYPRAYGTGSEQVILFVATREILLFEELAYDYGDTSCKGLFNITQPGPSS